MRPILIGLVVFALFPYAFVSAHSDITAVQTVGDHSVYMTFFGDAAFAGEAVDFNIFLYSDVANKPADFSNASVKISQKEGVEIFSGELEPPVESSPAYLTYTFPESGDYTLTFTLQRAGKEPLDVAFPLHVYAIPSDTYAEPQQGANSDRLMKIGSILGVLLLIAGTLYFSTRKTI